MIKLTDSIAPTYGNPEDIAQVQVLLARARHRLRPFWRGEIDGNMSPALRTAIEMFQYEAGILAPPLREDPGWIHPGGPTFLALKAAVPSVLHRMRVLSGTADVFMAQRSAKLLTRALASVDGFQAALSPLAASEIRELIEVTHTRLGLHLHIIDQRVVGDRSEVRLGLRGLSLSLPGGVFHTLPVANPWMVPDGFWHAIQAVAPEHMRVQAGVALGRGWLALGNRRQDAA